MTKRIIQLLVALVILCIIWFLVVLLNGSGTKEDRSFVIKSGQGVNQISRNLYDAGLIKSKLVFESWVWFKHYEDKVVAGAYQIPQNASIRQITNLIISGPQNSQASITLLEGWDRRAMAKALDKNGLSGDNFLEATENIDEWKPYYDFLADAPDDATLEGYIFPDTYFVDNYTTIDDFITKTLNNFDKKLTPELREDIAKQGKTIFEVVNLASIVEREVPSYADKKMIADIFLKRLDIYMGLQSDATINFITGKGTTQPSLEDLEIKSPYNTYMHRGLPPGPISSPGIDSIEAVVHPTSNPYYFFLTTDEGETIYSIDHEEHVMNKQKYLR